MQRTEPKTNPSFRSLAFNLSMAFEAVQVSSFRSLSKSLFGRSDLDFKMLASPRDATAIIRPEYQNTALASRKRGFGCATNLCPGVSICSARYHEDQG